MICSRCGEAEIATEAVFVVSHDTSPDLDAAIDAALRHQEINGLNALGELCESCWEVANRAIDTGTRDYFSTHRGVIEHHGQKNLGRPLTSTERGDINAYFDGAGGESSSSSSSA
jgi:hypothetical protein